MLETKYGLRIRGAGYYTDTYRLDDDGKWRIASTGYRRIYESVRSLADTPSFQLLTNMWAQPTSQ